MLIFKKSFRLISLLAMSLSLLTGCNNAPHKAEAALPQGTTESIAPSAPEELKPIQGGTVRTTVSTEPDHLDPHLSAAADTIKIMLNVFEGLMSFDTEGQIIPRLAEDVQISEDGLNYTFVIRTDVKFHNGNPLTVEDVIYSLNRLSGLGGEEALSSKFKNLIAVEKIDDQTLKCTLSERTADFLSSCTSAILPANYHEQSTRPIGTGPFIFKEYLPGQKIVLDANPNYYDTNRKPMIDTVEFRIMTDQNSMLLALKSGDLDLTEIDYINVLSLMNDYNVFSTPQNMVQLMALNNKIAPFDDLRVRQAINHAIDKNMLVQGVANGFGTKLYTAASPVMGFWYNDLSQNEPYPYDPDAAKTLLTEAGYPNGFTTTIKVPSNYQFHIDTAQVIADQLAQVGITLNIELIEWGQWLETVYNNANYETTIVGHVGKLDPHSSFIRYESSYANNYYNYSNPEYDTILNQANTEVDVNKRTKLYQEAQKILADDVAAIFIMDPHEIRVARPDLFGYTPYPVPFFDATKLYYVAE